MTSKKFIKIVLLTIGLVAIYPIIFLIQNLTLVKSYSIENNVELNTEDTKFIRCNYNILSPKFAYTFPFSDKVHISFFKTSELFSQTSEEWDASRIGGATVENTTFDELVKMVKEDCYQFQEDFDAEEPETQIDWGYREAEPPKTEEELEEEEVEGRRSYIRSLKYRVNELFTDLQKEKFTEFYGDVNSMTDDEVYDIAQQLAENDGIVDESLYEYFYSEYDLKYMRQ